MNYRQEVAGNAAQEQSVLSLLYRKDLFKVNPCKQKLVDR